MGGEGRALPSDRNLFVMFVTRLLYGVPMRLRRAAAGLALGLVAAALPCAPASADGLQDKQRQADALAAKIERLQSAAELLTEDYNATQVELQQAEQEVNSAKTRLTEQEADLSALRAQMSRFALNSYVYADQSTGVATLLDPATLAGEAAGRSGYAAVAMGANVDISDQLRAKLEDARRQQAALETNQKRLKRLSSTVAKQRSDVDKATKAAEGALGSVRGELVELVAEAERRREEEAAAAQQAAIERQQAEATAAAQAAATEAARAAARAAGTPSSTGPASSAATRPTSANRSASRTTLAPPTGRTPAAPAPPAPAPALPVPPPSAGAAGAVRAALSQVGGRYVAFAASPSTGFDCSGLTMWAWGQAGVSLPHYSRAQYASLPHVPLDQLQPGDLIFSGSPIHHVGMYVGGGQMVHAASSRWGIIVSPIRNVVGAARPGG